MPFGMSRGMNCFKTVISNIEDLSSIYRIHVHWTQGAVFKSRMLLDGGFGIHRGKSVPNGIREHIFPVFTFVDIVNILLSHENLGLTPCYMGGQTKMVGMKVCYKDIGS